MMSNELKELERRIIADMKGLQLIDDHDYGVYDGLKVAWYELNALDKPYVGGGGLPE